MCRRPIGWRQRRVREVNMLNGLEKFCPGPTPIKGFRVPMGLRRDQ